MERNEFEAKMEAADRKLTAKGVPPHQRQFPAFQIIAPGYQGVLVGSPDCNDAHAPLEGPRLFTAVGDWLERRHGHHALLDPIKARIPVLIRETIYFIKVPSIYGTPNVDAIKLVENMTDDMKRSLSGDEIQLIGNSCFDGIRLVYEVDDLIGKCFQHPTRGRTIDEHAADMIERSIADRDTASSCLAGRPKVNETAFHAQQSAEKMLKAFLIVKGKTRKQVRKHGHALRDIHADCIQFAAAFGEIVSDIGLLANIGMSVRYEGEVSNSQAIEAFWASLRTSGLAATQISSERRRFF